MVFAEFLDSFEEIKTGEQEQLQALQSNIVTTLEHISEVSGHFTPYCVVWG